MNRKSKKKILITGGTGFIGSSLVLALQDAYDITCLGRETSLVNLKKLANKNVALVRGDVSDEAVLARYIQGADVVVHLAGGGGNAACIKDPIWALATHIKGTYALVRKAMKYRVEKFIFASSYQIYGSAKQNQPIVEETAKPAPENFYANLKTIAERIIIDSGINYSILRLANVYGYSPVHGSQLSGAVNNFINSCLAGKSIGIQGSGRQLIDYIHLQDTICAIMAVLAKGQSRAIYNIGSGGVTTINGLATTVLAVGKRLYKKNISVRKIKHSAGTGRGVVCMSIKKASQELGWKPAIDLETGITELMLKNKTN